MTERELFLLKRNIKKQSKEYSDAQKRKRVKFKLNLEKRLIYIQYKVDDLQSRMSEKEKASYRKKILSLYRKKIVNIHKNILIKEHKKNNYSSLEKNVSVQDEFGLELGRLEIDKIEYFINKATEIIDFDARKLKIDIHECTKMWPSAITLLCSLVEWVEFGTRYNKKFKRPKMVSTYSNYERVNGYLSKSGFFDFIGKSENKHIKTGHPSHVIKIKRENTKDSKVVSDKEDGIIKLLEEHTNYTSTEIKSFVSNVIIEVFGNIQEHGFQVNDSGWWFLAQFHKNHNVVSINIADNGIGIKNSLLYGPQKKQIKTALGRKSKLDGELIKHAMKESVSGAFTASSEKKYGIYHRVHSFIGQRRGNGLDRIRETCLNLNIAFAIISHRGYIYYDTKGREKYGTMPKRIFAGTLYHFDFPVLRGKNDKS